MASILGMNIAPGHPHVWSSSEKLRDKVRTFAERAHHQQDPMALWMNLHTRGSTMTEFSLSGLSFPFALAQFDRTDLDLQIFDRKVHVQERSTSAFWGWQAVHVHRQPRAR